MVVQKIINARQIEFYKRKVAKIEENNKTEKYYE